MKVAQLDSTKVYFVHVEMVLTTQSGVSCLCFKRMAWVDYSENESSLYSDIMKYHTSMKVYRSNIDMVVIICNL